MTDSTKATSKDIEIERVEGGVGVIFLSRPDQKNMIRTETLEALAQALDELNADRDVRAIVLAGRGAHFCAGADLQFLTETRKLPPLLIQDLVYGKAQEAAKRLYNARKPTVAAVSGAAITLGCELSLCCDFRVVSDTAFFQELWVRVGLLPPLGGLFLLPRIVGLGRAAEIALKGRRVDAVEALDWGLANELVAGEGYLGRAIALARELGELPPQGYRLAKLGLHRGLESTIDHEWTANALAQPMLITSEDFREGLASVMERRPGRYQGR
ncbi:enoyl-CoA hydratase/isomerase family protein [Phenylobacterium sp.]|uniref:enoyl-CoA hydratase/isomerase family protein n=1 Tax=Phenylobacterium sp. TaxID=1871053 RepID=UPI00301D7011